MRPNTGSALLLLAVAAGGCDSEQPTLVPSQSVTLDFRAPGAVTSDFHTWIMFEDSNSDAAPDDVNGNGVPDRFLWCEPILGSMVPANSAPWDFTVTLKILGPGQTVPTIIAQDVSNNPARARYDALFELNPGSFVHLATIPPGAASLGVVTRTHPRGQCTGNTAIVCNPNAPMSTLCPDSAAGTCVAVGTCSLNPSQSCGFPGAPACASGTCVFGDVTRRFVFQNDSTRQRKTAANEELLLAPDNILFLVDPLFAETLISSLGSPNISDREDGGICPGTYLGPAEIDGMNLPLSLSLEKGATLIVEAKRLSNQPGGGIPFFAEPGLTALFRVNGAPATVNGNTSAGTGEDEFIQFFFTSQ